MSISLLICYRHPAKEDRLIPIASEEVFREHWKSISAELSLRWIPRFQHGWFLSTQDLPHLLEELGRLSRYLNCGETHAEIRHHMLARISALIRELQQLENGLEADAFIGSLSHSQRRVPLIWTQRLQPAAAGLLP